MNETIVFLSAPIALGALLVLIHAYLGLHVLTREVVFVDISLSQVAALGGTVALLAAHDHEDGLLSLGISLLLCLAVSLLLAWLRQREKVVSQEALIGMTYALASGATILVADRLPHGAEHLKEAMVGNILFVTWPDVFQMAIVYGLIGLAHWFFRHPFWAASRGESQSFTWDFLFYLLFGIVITFSTRHAGVLVVFSILVAPAALASRFWQGLGSRLVAAWLVGLVGMTVAFAGSYFFDLPAGAAIVCLLNGLFFFSLFASRTSPMPPEVPYKNPGAKVV